VTGITPAGVFGQSGLSEIPHCRKTAAVPGVCGSRAQIRGRIATTVIVRLCIQAQAMYARPTEADPQPWSPLDEQRLEYPRKTPDKDTKCHKE
jgi:hypothetical protein